MNMANKTTPNRVMTSRTAVAQRQMDDLDKGDQLERRTIQLDNYRNSEHNCNENPSDKTFTVTHTITMYL